MMEPKWVDESQVHAWQHKAIQDEPIIWPDVVWTLDQLWKVARAAKRWQKATPGRESCDREDELARLLEELPPTP